MLQKSKKQFGWLMLILITVAFSIKNIIEPDLWWQLAAGDRMLQTGSLLFNDPFTFTFPNMPWVNIKWITELIMVSIVRASSAEMLPILQVFMSLATLYVLYKTCRLHTDHLNDDKEHLAIITGMLLYLVMSEFRMNSRPEMFSHFFTALSILWYTKYLKHPSKKIFFMIPLQLLWTNMHDGYVIGIVLAIFFTIMLWMRYSIARVGNKPMQITYMLIGLLIAVCINPNGYHLIFRGARIFKQFTGFQFTTEFLDYTSYQYWTKESYMVMVMFCIVLLDYVFRIFRKNSPTFEWNFARILIANELFIPLALMGMFCVFALMGFRNIIYLSIVMIPHFTGILESLIHGFGERVHRNVHSIVLMISICLLLGIVSQKYYQWTNSRNRFGFEISSFHHPAQTAEFLKTKNYTGSIFSDYLTSAYFLWDLRPNFKVFIDLRDYEIYTPEFFAQYADITNSGRAFAKVDSQYHFEAIVLLNRQSQPLHKFLYGQSNFHLVHLDAVCAVYERGIDSNEVTYQFNQPWKHGNGKYLNQLFNPWYQYYQEDTDEEWERASIYYTMVGDYQRAYAAILHVAPNGRHADMLDEGAGNYYLNMARLDTTNHVKEKLDSSAMYFSRALRINKKRVGALNGLGAISYGRQQYKQAVKWWEEALNFDDNNLQIHLYLADCYEKLAAAQNTNENYRMEIFHLLKAYRLNPENPFIATDLGFIYAKLNDCNEAIPYLEKIKDFEGLSQNDRDLAKQYLSQCR